MTALADLITPTNATDELAALVATLQALGFPATSWQDGSVPKTLLFADATALAQVRAVVAKIAQGGFLDTSAGAWLTLHAKQRFNVDRKPATSTKRTVTLTAAAGAGPYTIAVGQLWTSTAMGLRFTNITGGTLNAGSTMDLTFRAESRGALYNVGTGSIRLLITSLAGVTVEDPADPTVDVHGTDVESDGSLVSRCRDRWATLGTGATAAAYRSWALAASSEITRAYVTGNDGTGQVSIVVAGDAGTVGDDAVDDAQAFIGDRAPLTVQATVVAATPVPIAVTATLYGKAAYETAARAAAAVNLAGLMQATDVGGTVYKAAIIEQLMLAEGVVNAVVSAPAGDTDLADTDVATLGTVTFTWVNT